MVQPREHQLGHSDVAEATTWRRAHTSRRLNTHTHVHYTKRQKKLTNMIISFFWFRRPRDLRLVPVLAKRINCLTVGRCWSLWAEVTKKVSIFYKNNLFPWLHPRAAARSELWQSTYCTQNADRQSAGRSQVWDCVSIESRTASRPEAADSWTNIEVRAQLRLPRRGWVGVVSGTAVITNLVVFRY